MVATSVAFTWSLRVNAVASCLLVTNWSITLSYSSWVSKVNRHKTIIDCHAHKILRAISKVSMLYHRAIGQVTHYISSTIQYFIQLLVLVDDTEKHIKVWLQCTEHHITPKMQDSIAHNLIPVQIRTLAANLTVSPWGVGPQQPLFRP